MRRQKSFQTHESAIDGEKLHVRESSKQGYMRLRVPHGSSGCFLHVHEAKKVYDLLGLEWPTDATVHHVDGQPRNNSLGNLCVFDTDSDHQKFHAQMEQMMYNYLYEFDLVEDFYKCYPNCKPKTLRDLLQEALDNDEL